MFNLSLTNADAERINEALNFQSIVFKHVGEEKGKDVHVLHCQRIQGMLKLKQNPGDMSKTA